MAAPLVSTTLRKSLCTSTRAVPACTMILLVYYADCMGSSQITLVNMVSNSYHNDTFQDFRDEGKVEHWSVVILHLK